MNQTIRDHYSKLIRSLYSQGYMKSEIWRILQRDAPGISYDDFLTIFNRL